MIIFAFTKRKLGLKVNEYFAQAYADGSMIECAKTYGVQAALIEQ